MQWRRGRDRLVAGSLPRLAWRAGSFAASPDRRRIDRRPRAAYAYAPRTAKGRPGRDWHVRLFRRDRRFSEDRVHEHLEAVQDVGALRAPIRHVPYRDLTHHLEKMIVYARWGAQELHAHGRRATAWDLLGRPAWRFVRDYVLYGSWRDGRFGLVTSLLTACAGFLKYAYLWELERAESARRPR